MENAVEMATGGIKVENEKATGVELDLATVKQVTQQVMNFGLENLEDPIYRRRLIENEVLTSEPNSSDLFGINKGDVMGQLGDGPLQLPLNLADMEKALAAFVRFVKSS